MAKQKFLHFIPRDKPKKRGPGQHKKSMSKHEKRQNFFSAVDNMFSWLETYSVKFTSWLWQSRVKLLRKKRKRK
jgi:hypothetical protein